MSGHDPQLLKGVLTPLLLQLLAECEDYGYSVVTRLHDLGFPDVAEGTVYPALSRMESQTLLASRLVRSTSGPARKYYSITASGLDELARASASWRQFSGTVERILAPPPHVDPNPPNRHVARSTP